MHAVPSSSRANDKKLNRWGALAALLLLGCGGRVELHEATGVQGAGGTAGGGFAGAAAGGSGGSSGQSSGRPPPPDRDAGSVPPTPPGLPTEPGPVQPPCYGGQPIGCDSETESYSDEQAIGEPFLDILSVYETHSGHSFTCSPVGVFRVSVTRPGDHVLLLSSYEPAHWVVEVGPRAKVWSVLIVGYNRSGWSVPDGVVVEDMTWETSGVLLPAAHRYPSFEAAEIIRFAESYTELPL